MKKKFLIVGVVILILVGAISMSLEFGYKRPQTHRKVTPEEFSREYPVQVLDDDIEFMMQTLEAVHPDLYYYTPRDSILTAKVQLEHSLSKPMTRVEFYPYLAKFVALFGDGHTTAVFPWEEWEAYTEQDNLVFPYDVIKTDAGVTIKNIYQPDSPLQSGDVLLSINHASVDSLFSIFIREISGEKMSFRTSVALRAFRRNLWLHGIRTPFHVKWKSHQNGKVMEQTITGIPYQEILQRRKEKGAGTQYYSFKRLTDDVGYINFRSMVDLSAFKKFLRTTFKDIKQHPIRGLIVDLRENGGGKTQLGEKLLSYITDKPYRFTARMEWKVSRQLKDYLRGYIPAGLRWLPLQYLHPMGRKIWTTPEGQMAVWEFEPEAPGRNSLRYKGPVCVLIGPHTFSSAMLLAGAIGDFHLATLIGQETGGVPNGFGELYLFDLPHTRLQVGVSTKRFVRANGNAEQKGGVQPDMLVTPKPEDIRRGVDTVLEAAKQWVFQQ